MAMVATFPSPADPGAGKLSSSPADKDQRQSESRGRDSRPLSDQQEWQAHKKATSHEAVHNAEQHENAKAEVFACRFALGALASGKLDGH
jgi:hypothetical protein